MMQEADRYAAEHKEELIGIVDRYWQIAEKFRGTPNGQAAQFKTDNALLTHELRSHQRIEQLAQRMRTLCANGKPQEGWDVWFDFPNGWRTKETDQEIMEIIDRTLPRDFQPKLKQ